MSENCPRWTEGKIAGFLARHTFEKKHLLLVPNCRWPGNECDLLAVTPNLRVIDIEIKISRADIKADAKKDKWYRAWDWHMDGPYKHDSMRKPRQWPRRVWKHYYCLPAEIWTPELLAAVNPVSGILLVSDNKWDGEHLHIRVERKAKPDRDAGKITAEDAVDIARLASLRMWAALRTPELTACEAILSECQKLFPECRAWGDLPGHIIELKSGRNNETQSRLDHREVDRRTVEADSLHAATTVPGYLRDKSLDAQ